MFGLTPRASCRLHLPRPIRDKADYTNTLEIAGALAGFEDSMSEDQDDYFDLLSTLIEVWEKEHVKWPHVTPLQTLKHLIAEHGMSGAELSCSRQLGPMILRGERTITADHARTLGAHFGLRAGIFVELITATDCCREFAFTGTGSSVRKAPGSSGCKLFVHCLDPASPPPVRQSLFCYDVRTDPESETTGGRSSPRFARWLPRVSRSTFPR